MSMIVKCAAADQIPVDHAGLVDKYPAADLKVEFALGHGGHAAAADTISRRGNLDAVTDAGDWSFFSKKYRVMRIRSAS